MTNRLVLLVAVATFVSAAGAIRAEEPSTQAASVDAVSRWTGARVEIQTAPTVDMPGVVKMQSGRDSIETARGVRIVAETRQALSACPPGCTAPVIIPKPSNRLVAVILAVDSGIVHLETKAHETVMLPVTAIASVRVIKKDALSGKRVRVDVGSVADLPSETDGQRPTALRHGSCPHLGASSRGPSNASTTTSSWSVCPAARRSLRSHAQRSRRSTFGTECLTLARAP